MKKELANGIPDGMRMLRKPGWCDIVDGGKKLMVVGAYHRWAYRGVVRGAEIRRI